MNNTIPLPTQPAADATLVFSWLGSLWTNLYEDKETIYAHCKGSSLVAAQVYLDFLELFNSFSRQDIPIFHREVWLPLLIRKSQRNLGQPIVCGQTPAVTVGPQPTGGAYRPDAVFAVGGTVSREQFVTYPYETDRVIAGGVSRVSDRIVLPGTVLLRGTHFTIAGTEIIFRESADPFANSDYLRREVVDPETGETDEEILLWATDVLVDWDYLYNSFGAVIGFTASSGTYYYNALNALWDLRFSGANLRNVRRALAGLLGVAVTGKNTETVADVVANPDGSHTIITGAATYDVPGIETLTTAVVSGAVLPAGSFLSETVHYYPRLDPDRFEAVNRLSLTQFLLDVPVLELPAGVAGNGVTGGINVEWRDVNIYYRGVDANGNPRLDFPVGGATADIETFWASIWARAENDNQSLADFFAPYLWSPPPYGQPGMAVGQINPLYFFMRNFFKYNVSVVVVDFDGLPAYIKSLSVFANVERLLPAHTVMLVLGRKRLADRVETVAEDSLVAQPGKAVVDSVPPVSEAGLQIRWVPR
jgi:hypothetical protein